MDQNIQNSAEKQIKKQHRRKIWKRIMMVLGSIVVFCTTYVLILPAITLSDTAYCGVEEHKHSDECYTHNLICELDTESGSETTHKHSETCYETEKILNCGQEESEGHTHDSTCVETEKTLTCAIAESEGHTHADACYAEDGSVICGQEESEGHKHDDSCYEEKQKTICGKSESKGHTHSDSCWTEKETLICKQSETESKSGHVHNEDCYEEVLKCELEEHTHETACFSNPEADVETKAEWEKTLPEELTGNWREDVLLIAESQLGYEESEDNYIVVDGKKKGYTRYGDWYGDKYGHWCAMFVSFCLDYAGVEGIPLDANCQHWIETLSKEEYELYHKADEYIPQPADLIFFDWDSVEDEENRDSEHIGFVVEVIEATEDEPAKVKTIEGNASDVVKYKTYEFEDESILGYGELPEKKPYVLETEGADYKVTVSFNDEAGIPEDAKLVVEEIPEGTEEYEEYRQQALDAMLDEMGINIADENDVGETEEVVIEEPLETPEEALNEGEDHSEYDISFARFFDIHFVVDGEEIQPKTAVNIQITYKDSVEIAEDADSNVVHFADEGIEILEATTSGDDTEEGKQIDTFVFTQGSFSVTGTVVYAARATSYVVWLDGTCGGLMNLTGSPNIYVSGNAAYMDGNVLNLPTEWDPPTKYKYKLKGWYDIYSHKYYAPGEKVTITQDAVFYADWEAYTYDVGQNNSHVVKSLDTNSFIVTNVFDYGILFNMQSSKMTSSSTLSASAHKEVWNVINHSDNNKYVPYSVNGNTNGEQTLGVIFRDWNDETRLSYPSDHGFLNSSQSTIAKGVLAYSDGLSGKSLLDILFATDNAYNVEKKTGIIGKTHVGQGNYLYQYMDESTANYDGEHNGYYYYDSKLNAASYNQSEQRFYIYDYLERTSDSLKDGNGDASKGAYSDFLPFNSPYANLNEGNDPTTYSYKGISDNYQYDAKYNQDSNYNDADNAGTNYFFGLKSEIRFYLPNDSGYKDEDGNYGNQSIQGEDLVFEFAGDDDVWVFVDGELVLDIGGLHGVRGGKIDFSTGDVTVDDYSDAETGDAQTNVSPVNWNFKEGEHVLTIYYMERGSSQSNCEIYFNIAPRYTLEITKQDAITSKLLDGAEFTFYTDAECTQKANLWSSEEEYHSYTDGDFSTYADEDIALEHARSTFTVVDGKLICWGFVAGHTYYIKETAPPTNPEYAGVMAPDDIIRMSLNNHGETDFEVIVLKGEDNVHQEGFEIVSFDIDEESKIAYMVVTNKKVYTDTTNVKVVKKWADGSTNIPDSISVYLTADGKKIGTDILLNEKNGWTYYWTNLPKYDDSGNQVQYVVSEEGVPGYTTSISEGVTLEETLEWVRTGLFEDGGTYLLATGENALAVSGSNFTSMTIDSAMQNVAGQWNTSADENAFTLKDGNGKILTFNSSTKEFYLDSEVENVDSLTQKIFFNGSHIYSRYGNETYYFGTSGNAVTDADDATNFTAYKLVDIGEGEGVQYTITNTPIPKEKQTFLNVTKVWDGDIPGNTSVTIRLYADGTDTGRKLILNNSTGWEGTFEGLPYENEDGSVIQYTVAEDKITGYESEISEVTSGVPAIEYSEWGTVSTLTNGKTYCFTYDGYALACDSDGNVVSAKSNSEDTYQQWTVTSSGSGYKLYNVGSGRYLQYNNGLSMTSYNSYATNWVFSSGKIYYNTNWDRYLVLGTNAVSTTTTSGSATGFTPWTETIITSQPGYAVTVTNKLKVGYTLPHTGGAGTTMYILGGAMLMLSAILIFIKRFFGRRLV